MERPERMVTIILGLLSGNVHISLGILAVMANLIAVQRIAVRPPPDGGPRAAQRASGCGPIRE